MRLLPLLTGTLLLQACVATTGTSGDGLCVALGPLTAAHSEALQGAGVPEPVLITGARLVAGIDAGCGGP